MTGWPILSLVVFTPLIGVALIVLVPKDNHRLIRWIAERFGGLLRRSQTGRVQNYGLGMAAGLVVVLLAYLVLRA